MDQFLFSNRPNIVLHIAATSAWLGSLFVIAILHWRGRMRSGIDLLLRHFSRIALPSAAVVTLTGLVAASIYVGSISNLFATPYGQTLLLKLAGFAAILGFGWRNWRRVRAGRPVHLGLLTAELAFAAAVIVITASSLRWNIRNCDNKPHCAQCPAGLPFSLCCAHSVSHAF